MRIFKLIELKEKLNLRDFFMMDINKLPNQLDEEEFENLIKKVREKTEAEIVSIEEKIKILTEYPI